MLEDGYQIRAFNELMALGFANFLGAFFGSVPTQVGLSRPLGRTERPFVRDALAALRHGDRPPGRTPLGVLWDVVGSVPGGGHQEPARCEHSRWSNVLAFGFRHNES